MTDYSPVPVNAIREALANCLINADYHGLRGVVIRKEPDKLVLANPGYIRTGKKQMRLGGESDPRNKALMKMFNLINIGERAGSGVPNIFNVWADEGWEEPVIEERFDPDRTILALSFLKKEDAKMPQLDLLLSRYLLCDAWRYIQILVKADVLESDGNTNNAEYILKKSVKE